MFVFQYRCRVSGGGFFYILVSAKKIDYFFIYSIFKHSICFPVNEVFFFVIKKKLIY